MGPLEDDECDRLVDPPPVVPAHREHGPNAHARARNHGRQERPARVPPNNPEPCGCGSDRSNDGCARGLRPTRHPRKPLKSLDGRSGPTGKKLGLPPTSCVFTNKDWRVGPSQAPNSSAGGLRRAGSRSATLARHVEPRQSQPGHPQCHRQPAGKPGTRRMHAVSPLPRKMRRTTPHMMKGAGTLP